MSKQEKQIDGTEFACLTINAWKENELEQKDQQINELKGKVEDVKD